jgi:hypothetical protein
MATYPQFVERRRTVRPPSESKILWPMTAEDVGGAVLTLEILKRTQPNLDWLGWY